jgi:hypothetical protein
MDTYIYRRLFKILYNYYFWNSKLIIYIYIYIYIYALWKFSYLIQMIKIIHSLQVNIGKIHLKVIFLNSFFERFVKAPIKTNDINSIYT